jgi:hypothetical protein
MANKSTYISKYDSTGAKWNTGFNIGDVDFWDVQKTSDGNIISYTKYGFTKIDVSTGKIIWTSILKQPLRPLTDYHYKYTSDTSTQYAIKWVVNHDDTITYITSNDCDTHYNYIGWIDSTGKEIYNFVITQDYYSSGDEWFYMQAINSYMCFDFEGGVFWYVPLKADDQYHNQSYLYHFKNGAVDWNYHLYNQMYSTGNVKIGIGASYYNIYTKNYMLYANDFATPNNTHYGCISPTGSWKWHILSTNFPPYQYGPISYGSYGAGLADQYAGTMGDRFCLFGNYLVDVENGNYTSIGAPNGSSGIYCYYPDGSIQWFMAGTTNTIRYPYNGSWHAITIDDWNAPSNYVYVNSAVQKYIHVEGGESYAYFIYTTNASVYMTAIKKIKLSDGSTVWTWTSPTGYDNLPSYTYMYYVDNTKLLIHYYAYNSSISSVYGSYITVALSNVDGTLIGISKSSQNTNEVAYDSSCKYRYGFIPTDK